MSEQTVAAQPANSAQRARRPAWALPVVVIAVLVTAVALVVGIVGLTGNPVKSTDASGVSTIQGTFEPYACSPASCNGYVQAGGRSVFVQFPEGCPEPARASTITVMGRAAPDLGKAAYRTTGCA